MSINDDKMPEFVKEDGLPASFGKRLFDKAVASKVAATKAYGHWSFAIFITSMVGLMWFLAAERVDQFSPKSIEFEVKAITSHGDTVTIPPLVLVFKQAQEFSNWAKVRLNPITVLSFIGDKKIPPGAEAKAMLLTGATNGLIKARLIESLKVDGVTILESGVLLMGQGHSSEERLFVDFKKAVFRDGKFIPVSGQAYDASDAILGLKGSLVGDKTMKLAASSGLNIISGLALGLETPSFDINGKPQRPTVRDAALNGVSQAASEQARSTLESMKGRPPIIEVKAGTVFQVTFDGGDQ